MASEQLKDKDELTSIVGTEFVYVQEAESPYTVKKTLFNTIKRWITGSINPAIPAAYYISSDYTITDTDGYIIYLINASSADVALTLPLKANNIKRRILVIFAKDTAGTHKVTISPNATDANSLSTDGLSSTVLPKVGNLVEFVEDQNTGYWIISRERITSQLRLNTYAGYGSTDTKIPRFTNSVENIGNMFTENHSTGYNGNAEGLKITIKRSGWYEHAYTFDSSSAAAEYMGLSLNSSQLTTTVGSITVSDVLHRTALPASSYFATVSVNQYFRKGDIIRPHNSGVTPYSAALVHYTCSYIGQ